MTLDTLSEEHSSSLAQAGGAGDLLQRDLGGEACLRKQRLHPLDPLNTQGRISREPAAHVGFAQRDGGGQPDEHRRAQEEGDAEEGCGGGLQVAKEPHDEDLHGQEGAERDPHDQVRHRARGQLHLVGPHARDHLEHQKEVDRKEDVSQDAMEQHQEPWRGADQPFVIERIAPQLEH